MDLTALNLHFRSLSREGKTEFIDNFLQLPIGRAICFRFDACAKCGDTYNWYNVCTSCGRMCSDCCWDAPKCDFCADGLRCGQCIAIIHAQKIISRGINCCDDLVICFECIKNIDKPLRNDPAALRCVALDILHEAIDIISGTWERYIMLVKQSGVLWENRIAELDDGCGVWE